MERYREKKKDPNMVFIDLENVVGVEKHKVFPITIGLHQG
jgi:hypothetical protein